MFKCLLAIYLGVGVLENGFSVKIKGKAVYIVEFLSSLLLNKVGHINFKVTGKTKACSPM